MSRTDSPRRKGPANFKALSRFALGWLCPIPPPLSSPACRMKSSRSRRLKQAFTRTLELFLKFLGGIVKPASPSTASQPKKEGVRVSPLAYCAFACACEGCRSCYPWSLGLAGCGHVAWLFGESRLCRPWAWRWRREAVGEMLLLSFVDVREIRSCVLRCTFSLWCSWLVRTCDCDSAPETRRYQDTIWRTAVGRSMKPR